MSSEKTLKERFLTDEVSSVCTIDATLKQQLTDEFKISESELCFALLPIAATLAHVPLSDFRVGAIVKGLSGTLYFGANMEFDGVAIGNTIHAEQAAFNNAWMHGEKGISDIYVSASPCGHCRQFLNEISTSEKLTVWVKDHKQSQLKTLLPEDFGPADLEIDAALMANQPADASSGLDSAFARSYSPYTQSPSAVAVTMQSGKQYFGSYAENAAFNPSLPPLQSALIMCLLHNEKLSNISDVILTELRNSRVKHGQTAELMCSVIIPAATFHLVEEVH